MIELTPSFTSRWQAAFFWLGVIIAFIAGFTGAVTEEGGLNSRVTAMLSAPRTWIGRRQDPARVYLDTRLIYRIY